MLTGFLGLQITGEDYFEIGICVVVNCWAVKHWIAPTISLVNGAYQIDVVVFA
jgi:hypothetical protein